MGSVCPLALLAAGTEATIIGIQGGRAMRVRLSGMGFCPDARVMIWSANQGSAIVSVGGARYALSRGMAAKILVRETREAA